MRTLRIIILSLMCFLLFQTVSAQDFLQKARQCITEGDCDRAQENYDAYKFSSGKTDKEVERLIKECKSLPKEDPSKPQELRLYNGRYVGEVANGKPHGTGVFYDNNGDRYEGFWENGYMQHGTALFASGDKYEGTFKNGMVNGNGVMTKKNGNKVEGFWENNKLLHGTLFFANGDKYEGAFKNGIMDGYGVFTQKDGQVTEGYWENGVLKNNTEINNNNHIVPPKKTKRRREWICKPDENTKGVDFIGGASWGIDNEYTLSYFLFEYGFDALLFAPKHTTESALVNSGYTGNFTKTTTMELSGRGVNAFLAIGAFFKYFSVSCRAGLLVGKEVTRTAHYDGWGYGLVDGNLNEYWGSYEQRSFDNTTTTVKKPYFTLTPQVKVYIPIDRNETTISIGLGYSFVPALDYYAWFSASLGLHFEF